MSGYVTSTDYERLWELVNSGEKIVCFVDYDPPETGMLRVVAVASFAEGHYIIATPGVCHSCGETIEKFIARCKAINLGFIDPASQQKTAKEKAADEMHDWLNWLVENGMTVANPNDIETIRVILKKARGEA